MDWEPSIYLIFETGVHYLERSLKSSRQLAKWAGACLHMFY